MHRAGFPASLLRHHITKHATMPAYLPASQVALLLGGAVGVTAVLLQRSWAEQARLAALLSKRETDLARLVSWVAECSAAGCG